MWPVRNKTIIGLKLNNEIVYGMPFVLEIRL